MNKYKKLSEEVSCEVNEYSSIGQKDIDYLVQEANNLSSKKYRLCMHEINEDPIHEMFIIHPCNMYVRPHKHNNKSESMIVISGEADYIIFNENGCIEDIIRLASYNEKKKFYVKIRKSLYHTLLIYSEYFVFLEITKGPFIRNDTIFPNWAPEQSNNLQVKHFMKELSLKVQKYNNK